jgi:hypothetical protein
MKLSPVSLARARASFLISLFVIDLRAVMIAR